MNIFKEVYLGLTHKGAMPQNAVSSNRDLYGNQGQKHLNEPGAPGFLDSATNRQDRRVVLTRQEQDSQADWDAQNKLKSLSQRR